MKNKFVVMLFAVVAGFLNAAFGAGGGMVVVPMLKKSGVDVKKAHATSVSIILCLSLVSFASYFLMHKFDIAYSMQFIPSGILGACLGCVFLNYIKTSILKKVFAVYIIFASFRLLLK